MKKTSFIVFLFFSILLTSDKFLNIDNSNSPVYIQLSAVTSAQAETQTGKKQSFKERMCSTITDFLEDKITTTKKGSSTSNILQGSLKEVNGLCGKGIIPQVSEIKGLSPKDKEILNKKTENTLKKFYDGAGDLPDEDFDGIKLKSSKTSSGTSGTRLSGDTVSDLKSYDPSISGLKSGGEPISDSDKSHAPTLLASSANTVPKLETAKAQEQKNPDDVSTDPSLIVYNTNKKLWEERCDSSKETIASRNADKVELIKAIRNNEIYCNKIEDSKARESCYKENVIKWQRTLELTEHEINKATNGEKEWCVIPKIQPGETGECVVYKKNVSILQNVFIANYKKDITYYEKEYQTCLKETKKCVDRTPGFEASIKKEE